METCRRAVWAVVVVVVMGIVADAQLGQRTYPCILKLTPCTDKTVSQPSAACCSAVEGLVRDELPCLCADLRAANASEAVVTSLAGLCGINTAAGGLCPSSGPPPPSSAPPPAEVPPAPAPAAKPPSAAPPGTSSCVRHMSPCANKTVSQPSPACCAALGGVVRDERPCLCAFMRSSNLSESDMLAVSEFCKVSPSAGGMCPASLSPSVSPTPPSSGLPSSPGSEFFSPPPPPPPSGRSSTPSNVSAPPTGVRLSGANGVASFGFSGFAGLVLLLLSVV